MAICQMTDKYIYVYGMEKLPTVRRWKKMEKIENATCRKCGEIIGEGDEIHIDARDDQCYCSKECIAEACGIIENDDELEEPGIRNIFDNVIDVHYCGPYTEEVLGKFSEKWK